jgi:tetratricopeptide (TPR) repeat protein
MRIACRERLVVVLLVAATALGVARPSLADAPAASERKNDAADHFKRGVTLYKDRDFVGALVEFRRAYELLPNYRVLYDIGQSLYQLQRYAEALTTFESYLAQGGAQVPAARRASVENDLKALHARVGSLRVSVNMDGAEIRVDDQTVGASPLDKPLLVSVGHRKITVSKAGTVPAEKFVDVAAGDRANVTFELVEPTSPNAVAAVPPPPAPQRREPSREVPTTEPPATPAPEPEPPSSAPVWIAWTTTTLLAAGTAVTGALVLNTKSTLSSQLQAYPADPSAIDSERTRGKTLATASDILLAATAVSLAVSLYVTLSHGGAGPEKTGRNGADVKLGLGLGGLQLRGDY